MYRLRNKELSQLQHPEICKNSMQNLSFCFLQELSNSSKAILNLISTQASHIMPIIAVIVIANIASLHNKRLSMLRGSGAAARRNEKERITGLMAEVRENG